MSFKSMRTTHGRTAWKRDALVFGIEQRSPRGKI